jgi:hypothetical protein
MYSCDIPGCAKSRIHFNDIDSYTLSAKAKWAGPSFYVRLSAEYGLSDKGRARERFNLNSPWLFCPISVETSDPVKRRSEVYDFNGAVGYPFTFFHCRLNVIPLVGFSYHRQRLRVKQDEKCCYSHSSSGCYDCCDDSSCGCCLDCCDCCSPNYTCSEFFDCHSSDSFFVRSCNPFYCSPSHNPFGSPCSDPTIASALGLWNPHRTSNYRFTWYGFYLGADLAYAVDCCWTLFTELEFHFLDHCHRKRDSQTGVYFVDDYHKKKLAYGFNGVLGTTYCIANCWYGTLSVDFNWWKSDAKHDHLEWKKVGAKIGLGYMF